VDFVRLINHPGLPWGVGGLVGAVIGMILGQPTCSSLLGPCTPARIPVVDILAGPEVFVALFTVVGAVVAYGIRKASA
jgi:hypothetical protein